MKFKIAAYAIAIVGCLLGAYSRVEAGNPYQASHGSSEVSYYPSSSAPTCTTCEVYYEPFCPEPTRRFYLFPWKKKMADMQSQMDRMSRQIASNSLEITRLQQVDIFLEGRITNNETNIQQHRTRLEKLEPKSETLGY